MTNGRSSGLLARFSTAIRTRFENLRWWIALRVGGAPPCAVCENEAAWIAETRAEPRCFKHIPNDDGETIRDVRPEDCFTDWGDTDDR